MGYSTCPVTACAHRAPPVTLPSLAIATPRWEGLFFAAGFLMTDQTTLTLKNDISEVERVMSIVAGLCARNSIPPETEYDLNLAMDEMIANVAKHAYPEG